jgi:TusA-related sulfurtransferase
MSVPAAAAAPPGLALNGESPDRVLDITGEVCPMTLVRTRLALDALAPGQVLEVWLQGEEPVRSVPRAAAALGHDVLGQAPLPQGGVALRLRRR